MKIKWEKTWITSQVSKVTWVGSATQCSRALIVSVLHNPYDNNFKELNIKLGDMIYLYHGSKQLMVGEVTRVSRTEGKGTYEVEAKDGMNHLIKSKISRNFRNTCAEKVTESICKEMGMRTKNVVATKINIAKYYPREESPYNIILGAYKKASKTTKIKYMLTMDGTALSVIEKGEDSGVVIRQDTNLLASSYEITLDEMINRVAIYNGKGKKIGIVENEGWIKKYGIYQAAYEKEEGENSKTAAKSILKGVDKSASVEALGNILAISGKAIKIKDTGTGLTGKFWIETDEHTWENGVHKMTLELTFQNLMESVSVSEADNKEKKENGGVPDSEKAKKLLSVAKSMLGKVRYSMGASSPEKGVSDCSAFTQYCFRQVGYEIGRTTNSQLRQGEKVEKSQLKQGDLVLFRNTYNSGYTAGVSHVGIYVGQNQFIHCSSGARTVTISSLTGYYMAHWLEGRRVLS